MAERLTLASAPKWASMRTYDCARCAHEELTKPVWLSDGHAYGTRCAAVMLGLVPDTATAGDARKALRAAQAEKAAADQRAGWEAHRVADAEWQRFLDAHAGPGDRCVQIAQLGGFAAAHAAFKKSSPQG